MPSEYRKLISNEEVPWKKVTGFSMSSKEPRPAPKPGDPQYRDPSKPHPVSPPPPAKKK